MALCATALKLATVAAIFMVLVLSSDAVKKPAGAETSCKEHDCISKCPSNCRAIADKVCGGYKQGPPPGCIKVCENECHTSCGVVEACHATCPDKKCVKKCYATPWPEYKPCLSGVLKGCKKDCEAGCKGDKVQG
jgi:hypothetical protein